jgi:hypothetical protein
MGDEYRNLVLGQPYRGYDEKYYKNIQRPTCADRLQIQKYLTAGRRNIKMMTKW